MKTTFKCYSDNYAKAVLQTFREALEPVMARMNQDFALHHMEVDRRDIEYGRVEEVVVKIILRHPKDFNYRPEESDQPLLDRKL